MRPGVIGKPVYTLSLRKQTISLLLLRTYKTLPQMLHLPALVSRN